MKYGFIRLAAATPKVTVANCAKNTEEILSLIKQAEKKDVTLLVFPELALTGYTCGDLFFQKTLLDAAWQHLQIIAKATKKLTAIVGLPLAFEGKIYNVAAVLAEGEILALVPKTAISDSASSHEKRYFAAAFDGIKTICTPLDTKSNTKLAIPFGTRLLFKNQNTAAFTFAVEIGNDAMIADPPSREHTEHGATIIVNPSASNQIIGKSEFRRMMLRSLSARCVCGYVQAEAGTGESTTDLVFAGHNLLCENGQLIAESQAFQTESFLTIAEFDVQNLIQQRQSLSTWAEKKSSMEYLHVPVNLREHNGQLQRAIPCLPFIPTGKDILAQLCQEIVQIQAAGLAKRLRHTNCTSAVIGLSGGLDSTLALLVTVEAFKMLQLKTKNITAISMPCLGTTARTSKNAQKLAQLLEATFREIPIRDSVLQHFKDIGHDPNNHSITYENAQARERTQVLMDVANSQGALVVGTGDLSEMALGWCTYNGDHMSMYSVNASIPKTLVRHLVAWFSTYCPAAKEVLLDILDTPVSPELLPPKDGVISQKTEEIVGPYELHDFFLYYFVRRQCSPEKIQYLAEQAFIYQQEKPLYDSKTIKKWLTIFIRRFFNQQFKRSCVPDGPTVGTVGLSPRGAWQMPSDADAELWLSLLKE